jgi:hypothetical protein
MFTVPPLVSATAVGAASAAIVFFGVPACAALWRGEGAPGVTAALAGGADSSDDDQDKPIHRLRRTRQNAGTLVRRSVFCQPHAGVKVYNDGVATLLLAPTAAIISCVAVLALGDSCAWHCIATVAACSVAAGRVSR